MRLEPTEISVCADPLMLGENGHFAVTDGSFVWTVIVTAEAMKATASPPEASVKRLAAYVRMYVAMARAALAAGRGTGGRIWIFEKDVLAFRRTRHRHSVRRSFRTGSAARRPDRRSRA